MEKKILYFLTVGVFWSEVNTNEDHNKVIKRESHEELHIKKFKYIFFIYTLKLKKILEKL
jgi:hypothetical protein